MVGIDNVFLTGSLAFLALAITNKGGVFMGFLADVVVFTLT